MMAEHAKSDHCISSNSNINSNSSSNHSETMSMRGLFASACGRAAVSAAAASSEMEDGVHLMLDKTSEHHAA
jgi:hypothetical protein